MAPTKPAKEVRERKDVENLKVENARKEQAKKCAAKQQEYRKKPSNSNQRTNSLQAELQKQ